MPPVHSTLAEVVSFLERHPPFSELTKQALEELARTAEIEYVPRGTVLIEQGGAPSSHLYTVYRGSVELVHGDEVVDVLDAGESFGHPSLASGAAPALGARTREDTLCYLFPAEHAVRALARPEGLRFVAATLEDRLRWTSARSRATTPWGAGRVGQRTRSALVLDAATSIRDAATRMTAENTPTAVVATAGEPYVLVSDADLRASVVTGRVGADAPLSALDLGSALVAGADRLASDLAMEMLETGAEHAIVVDDAGALVGVVDHAALLDLESPSQLAVRRDIDRSRDAGSVATAVGRLPRVAIRLLDAGAGPLAVLEIVAGVTDAATRRLTELARSELGEPPVPWAWLSLGSEARREQTLATDQDNALAYDGAGAEVDAYFAELAARVNRWLAECGFAECRAGVMARNPAWRLARERWLALIEEWMTAPSRRDVHLAMIGFDLRQVTGTFDLEREIDVLLASAPRHPYLLERLTQAALELRPPLGLLRDFVVEHGGARAGTLDLKSVGAGPIVNLARRHALAAGSAARSTVDRLRAAVAGDVLSKEAGAELEAAFVTISRVRLLHQASQIDQGVSPDNHVDPGQLAPSERRELKDAFRAVARAQKDLAPRTATRIP